MNETKEYKEKEYDVSIEMITDASISSAKDLSAKLKWDKNLFKRRKKPLATKKKSEKNYWVLRSKANNSDPLIDHLDDLKNQLSGIKKTVEHPSVKEVYLVIGVFYDSDYFAHCSVLLPTKDIENFNSLFKHLKLEIICYPCQEEP